MVVSDALKKRKKIWVSILAPKEFKEKEVGESYVYLHEQVLGKTIEVNLSNLIGDPKKQNINVLLRVKEIKENKAHTEMIAYTLAPSYLKRLTRMNKGRAEQSLALKTKDGKKLRIKALALTKFEPQNSILTAVRTKMKELLIANVQSNTFEDLMNGVIGYEFQKVLSKELKSIYPLSYVLIRYVKLTK
ncbi:MAG: hypothetical protein PHF86_09095 [Candidatus Nanoarchaeia archaeon]|nr:hypothetical protein [Candidatus Nanoarchaeia archaeon]